jgi:Zn ribbon nucleic-acid-binding protein
VGRMIDWFRKGRTSEPIVVTQLLKTEEPEPQKLRYPSSASIDKAWARVHERIDAIPEFESTVTCVKCGSDMIGREYRKTQVREFIPWDPETEEEPRPYGFHSGWETVSMHLELMDVECLSCGFEMKSEHCLDYSKD